MYRGKTMVSLYADEVGESIVEGNVTGTIASKIEREAKAYES